MATYRRGPGDEEFIVMAGDIGNAPDAGDAPGDQGERQEDMTIADKVVPSVGATAVGSGEQVTTTFEDDGRGSVTNTITGTIAPGSSVILARDIDGGVHF
jgi:hypothetical protein